MTTAACATQQVSRSRRIMLVLLITLVVLVLDHGTKWWAIAVLKNTGGESYLGDIFRLQYAENTGAFLSLGSQLSESARFWLLTGVNSVILVVVAGVLIAKRSINLSMVWALSLILSGGIGNIIDRIFRDGRVVDFLNMGIPWGPLKLRTGIFNIADVAIMLGLFIIVAAEIFHKEPEEAGAKESTQKTD